MVAAIVNLVALLAQTGTLFFWGGRLSERQKVHGEQISDLGGRVRTLEQTPTPPNDARPHFGGSA